MFCFIRMSLNHVKFGLGNIVSTASNIQIIYNHLYPNCTRGRLWKILSLTQLTHCLLPEIRPHMAQSNQIYLYTTHLNKH